MILGSVWELGDLPPSYLHLNRRIMMNHGIQYTVYAKFIETSTTILKNMWHLSDGFWRHLWFFREIVNRLVLMVGLWYSFFHGSGPQNTGSKWSKSSFCMTFFFSSHSKFRQHQNDYFVFHLATFIWRYIHHFFDQSFFSVFPDDYFSISHMIWSDEAILWFG